MNYNTSYFKEILETQPELLYTDTVLGQLLDDVSFIDFITEVSSRPDIYDVLNSKDKQSFWRQYYLTHYPHIDQSKVLPITTDIIPFSLGTSHTSSIFSPTSLDKEYKCKNCPVKSIVNKRTLPTWFEQCCIQEINYFFNPNLYGISPFFDSPWINDILDIDGELTNNQDEYDIHPSKLKNIKNIVLSTFHTNINGDRMTEKYILVLYQDNNLYYYKNKSEFGDNRGDNSNNSGDNSNGELILSNVNDVWNGSVYGIGPNDYEDFMIFTNDNNLYMLTIFKDPFVEQGTGQGTVQYNKNLLQLIFNVPITRAFHQSFSSISTILLSLNVPIINNPSSELDIISDKTKNVIHQISLFDIINDQNTFTHYVTTQSQIQLIVDVNTITSQYDPTTILNEAENEDEIDEDLEIIECYSLDIPYTEGYTTELIYLNKKRHLHYLFAGKYDYNLSIHNEEIRKLEIIKIEFISVASYKFDDFIKISHRDGIYWLPLPQPGKYYDFLIGNIKSMDNIDPRNINVYIAEKILHRGVNIKVITEGNDEIKVKDTIIVSDGEEFILYVLDITGNVYDINDTKFKEYQSDNNLLIKKNEADIVATNINKFLFNDGYRIIGLNVKLNRYIIVPYVHYIIYKKRNMVESDIIIHGTSPYILFQIYGFSFPFKAYIV